MKKLLCLVLLALSFAGQSQHIIRGKVINAKTNESLPFVNIAVKDSRQGTTSDVEGRFTINLSEQASEIQFSAVGFEKLDYQSTGAVEEFMVIRLKEKTTELQEIVVRAGENPAFKILRKAIR
ncbi:MAG TPA: carboxypeptidase-like regulatory domain-containing protein, partial [Cyclobacteriaceae bacterium]|nr:carboxypeptidase-like regulatory domain-containing protein [Cyclobacteriaceae bacterium]